MKVIDLSHPVANGMPLFPGTPPIMLKASATLNSEGFNELQLQITTHTGTHIDCPLHMIKGGFDTTADVTRFCGKGVMIDCTKTGISIPLSHIETYRKVIEESDFVLLNTGWHKHWEGQDYYNLFPVLSSEAAEYIQKFNLKGIGIDTPSFDPVNSSNLPVHNLFLSKGIILIENLTNMDSLPHKGFIFSCFPLKIKNGDGCPVRATGIITNQE